MAGYIIVGGFSYEDRSRAGIIAALDPIMQEIKQQSEKGKPDFRYLQWRANFGGNGFSAGLENNKLGMVLTENKRIAARQSFGHGLL